MVEEIPQILPDIGLSHFWHHFLNTRIHRLNLFIHMDDPFKIDFNFNLDSSMKILRLQGEVELHHPIPHYTVSKINMYGHASPLDLLPDIDIKCIIIDGRKKWVHTDSGKESNLSRSAGEAIERSRSNVQVAEEDPHKVDYCQ